MDFSPKSGVLTNKLPIKREVGLGAKVRYYFF